MPLGNIVERYHSPKVHQFSPQRHTEFLKLYGESLKPRRRHLRTICIFTDYKSVLKVLDALEHNIIQEIIRTAYNLKNSGTKTRF